MVFGILHDDERDTDTDVRATTQGTNQTAKKGDGPVTSDTQTGTPL